MPTYWSGALGGHDPADGYRPFGRVLPDPSEALQPFLPAGWLTQRSSARRWLVYGPARQTGPTAGTAVLVGDLVWLHTDEWGVMPVGEVLAWGRSYSTAVGALDALVAWWNTGDPTSEPTT